jgi:hypothetical protein
LKHGSGTFILAWLPNPRRSRAFAGPPGDPTFEGVPDDGES